MRCLSLNGKFIGNPLKDACNTYGTDMARFRELRFITPPMRRCTRSIDALDIQQFSLARRRGHRGVADCAAGQNEPNSVPSTSTVAVAISGQTIVTTATSL